MFFLYGLILEVTHRSILPLGKCNIIFAVITSSSMGNYGVSTLHLDIDLHDPDLLRQTSVSWPGTISNTPVVDISTKNRQLCA